MVTRCQPVAGNGGPAEVRLTPSGVSINHRGIAPDIEFERDQAGPAPPPQADAPILERDPEVKRALEQLKVMSARGAVSASLGN